MLIYYSPFFVRETEERACLLIIQCDFDHADDNLIACACYCIYNMRAKALLDGHKCTTHVLFIIHLPVQATQSSFMGFQGGPWVCCHIDELRSSSEVTLTLEMAQSASISSVFRGNAFSTAEGQEEKDVCSMTSQCTRLNSCIQAAASRLQDSKQRATKRVKFLTDHIPSSPSFPLGE